MITSICIAGAASYCGEAQVLDGLSQFNFFYGPNASGKTTISRIIAEPGIFPGCSLTWAAGTMLQPMVYNRDFIEKNFSQSAQLKGIFTLGEKSVDAQNKIAVAKAKIDEITRNIEQLTKTLQGDDGKGGKRGDLSTLEDMFKDTCWRQKQKHDAKLSGAFEGFRANATKFKEKILLEKTKNSATLEKLAELETRAETAFGPTPVAESSIISPDGANLLALESSAILRKAVVGKADVDIAAMIQKLGNSDWVKQGRAYYEVNNKRCPFCQQSTPSSLEQSLNEYFDETFEKDSETIRNLEADYKSTTELIHKQIDSILAAPSKFLDVEQVKANKAAFDSTAAFNIQQIATKKKEPSRVIELKSMAGVLASLAKLVGEANSRISTHNSMVKNLAKERSQLTAQVWRHLLDVELKTDLANYESTRGDLKKAIESLSEKIRSAQEEKSIREREIRELERGTTSIEPTIAAINATLSSFGFLGFSLTRSTDGKSYSLVRANGLNAKETLSEGEQSFITFLYFYNLLKGSNSEDGTATDRVVVFDDPVSSLDSNVLFVVSGLIRGLCQEVHAGEGHIKQIFVLTHNVYFHKEVTFSPRRKDSAMNKATFWMVRRRGLTSEVEKYSSNPVKTAYEMLWAEVRDPKRSKHTIQNVLRRILESYFQIMGDVNPEAIYDMFEGQDKVICRSLSSWVHAGSHHAHDDLYVSIDDSTIDAYLSVFKRIFEKSGHLPHYEMMMRGVHLEAPITDLAA